MKAIPIHFIWIQGEIYKKSPHIKEAHDAMLELLSPKYTCILWDGKRIEDFLKRHNPPLLELYLKSTVFAQKADIARYAIVYEFGGIYLDIDLCIQDKLGLEMLWMRIQPQGVLFRRTRDVNRSDLSNLILLNKIEGYETTVQNNIIFATAQHPFIKHLCDHIVSNQLVAPHGSHPHLQIMWSTSPFMVTHQLHEYPHKEDIFTFDLNPWDRTFQLVEHPEDRADWSDSIENNKALTWISYNVNILWVVTFIILIVLCIGFSVRLVSLKKKIRVLQMDR